MKLFLGIVLILGAVFYAGYYVGKLPPEEVKQQIQQMIGLDEGKLILQDKFLQAKAKFLDGKADILDGNYDKAVTELNETLDHLKHAAGMAGEEISNGVLGARSKIENLHQSLVDGRKPSREAMDDAQDTLDALLEP